MHCLAALLDLLDLMTVLVSLTSDTRLPSSSLTPSRPCESSTTTVGSSSNRTTRSFRGRRSETGRFLRTLGRGEGEGPCNDRRRLMIWVADSVSSAEKDARGRGDAPNEERRRIRLRAGWGPLAEGLLEYSWPCKLAPE